MTDIKVLGPQRKRSKFLLSTNFWKTTETSLRLASLDENVAFPIAGNTEVPCTNSEYGRICEFPLGGEQKSTLYPQIS